ncbi:glycosyltransferase involved in cell wall biosynthesis [Sphingomonas sp. BE138]|uniref:glycosyltransferase family 4 protein n=1 Tax=Sphingomonas sp. BE138 TaxID=2817845 RepID=UPI00285FFFAD|nr:glycosyltransferase family 4 protein [Sphingomonas sp. BE138]MDR6788466.1 glycosyltransferase involved in cell wall biosynthesis [Sphingomonas sp. BE138]
MRILFALPGFHRFERGAEIALLSLATELGRAGEQVAVIGSGIPRADTPYRFIHAGSVRREKLERLPRVPVLRSETGWEEATFAPGLLRAYRPHDHDVTVTCSFPFTNWVLRRPVLGGRRPPHVFVTQNGDWPAISDDAEYRSFGCEGLVCTNPDYLARNRDRWRCSLIPNGIDATRFTPGAPERARLGLPEQGPVVLMVSALIASKRVADGVRAVAQLPGAHLVVAGDGPERDAVDRLAGELLPGRFRRLTVAAAEMPALYRSADVFLHLSKEESFGNVFIEALGCGAPVVGHDSDRLRWIVGDDAVLLDTSDPAAVARALGEAIARRETLVPRGVARAADFAWPRVAAQYRDFLAEVIAAAR